jgi:hypothetical protein
MLRPMAPHAQANSSIISDGRDFCQWDGLAVLLRRQQAKLTRGAKDEEAAMSRTPNTAIAVTGIDIGKNSLHVLGHDARGAIMLRQKWSRGQLEARRGNGRGRKHKQRLWSP